MELDLTPRELLTTTRTVRKRLDLERPVEREVVEDCLRIAFQAPNGSNQQTWGWVLVDDGLSSNGTFVNGERLNGTRRLDDGDTIRFGTTTVTRGEFGGEGSWP